MKIHHRVNWPTIRARPLAWPVRRFLGPHTPALHCCRQPRPSQNTADGSMWRRCQHPQHSAACSSLSYLALADGKSSLHSRCLIDISPSRRRFSLPSYHWGFQRSCQAVYVAFMHARLRIPQLKPLLLALNDRKI